MKPTRREIPLLPFALSLLAAAVAFAGSAGAAPASAVPAHGAIPAWTSLHGHRHALVAIAAENGGTELTDFTIPYGVLMRAGIDTVTVAVREGPVRFRPALRAQLDGTMADFDREHPEGADYVIVPAMVDFRQPMLLAWIQAQARKGAIVVSICDGAFVLAQAGLLQGRTATAHWASDGMRRKAFPATHWVGNTRYVADGAVVSSAGISAAMPTSLALVEAIAGAERAAVVAREIGVGDWSARHDSDAFRPRMGNLGVFAVKLAINPWLHGKDTVGVPLAPGMDEIELAIVADAYSRTGRSQAVAMGESGAAVPSLHGLRFLPDESGATTHVDYQLPPLAGVAPGEAFDAALASVQRRYGQRTAQGVAVDFEYPWTGR